MRGALPVSAMTLGVAAALALAMPSPAHAVSQHYIQVGTRCQQDFQYNWQADAGLGNNDMWARCGGFQSAASTTEVNAFYYNLHGARWALEDPDTCGWACGNADAVDLFYMSTHGGITSTSAIWAMWDWGSLAYTENMRLGASGRQNMVLATFACDTHWIDDNTWTRWAPVFAGGMVVTVGGHNLLYQGNPQTGSDFANRMNNGEPIGQSWLESTWYADNRNAPAVITTGRDATDCWNRQGSATTVCSRRRSCATAPSATCAGPPGTDGANSMRIKWTTYPLAAACLAGATLAQAGSFQRADDNAAQSLAAGLGSSTPLLLQRLPGNAPTTLATLKAAVCKRACTSARSETRGGVLHVSGDGWQLDVSADGTMAEFSDEQARARSHDLGVDANDAMPVATLEAAGRQFIGSQLAGVIELRPGERLVQEATYARNEGGSDAKGNRAPERTTAHRIVFTREIDGIPVVGNGSKIVVTFLNDMTVESFRYDWPAYVIRGSAPAMASRDVLLQRVQNVIGGRTGQPATKSIGVRPGDTTVDLGAGAELNRFECGYYDAGVAGRDASAPIQAGCVYHAVHSETGAVVTRAGYSGAVPAAIHPENDARWPEEQLLRGQQVAREAGDPGAAIPR